MKTGIEEVIRRTIARSVINRRMICMIDRWSYLRNRKPPMTSFIQHRRGTELFQANKTHLSSKKCISPYYLFIVNVIIVFEAQNKFSTLVVFKFNACHFLQKETFLT